MSAALYQAPKAQTAVHSFKAVTESVSVFLTDTLESQQQPVNMPLR